MAEKDKVTLSKERLSAMLTAAKSFPHVAEDWTPLLPADKIKSIRYNLKAVPREKRRAYARLDWRLNLTLAMRSLLPSLEKDWEKVLMDYPSGLSGAAARARAAWHHLTRVNNHRPDAVLYGGSVLTFWAEHGEYIAAMKPQDVEAALGELRDLRAQRETLASYLEECEQTNTALSSAKVMEILSTSVEEEKDYEGWSKLIHGDGEKE